MRCDDDDRQIYFKKYFHNISSQNEYLSHYSFQLDPDCVGDIQKKCFVEFEILMTTIHTIFVSFQLYILYNLQSTRFSLSWINISIVHLVFDLRLLKLSKTFNKELRLEITQISLKPC